MTITIYLKDSYKVYSDCSDLEITKTFIQFRSKGRLFGYNLTKNILGYIIVKKY